MLEKCQKIKPSKNKDNILCSVINKSNHEY